MGLSKLSVSLLALASSAIGADLPSITAKVSHFFVSRTPTISLLVGINRGEGTQKTINKFESQSREQPLIDHFFHL